jgi:glycosyltransferase involved in cell wall biosynthesis
MSSEKQTSAVIGVVLCTYNGENYLNEQIESIVNQTYKNWKIFVSDDGSTDQTLDILRGYKDKLENNKIDIYYGPQQGFAKNFIGLLRKVNSQCEYYAICDQDDIWDSDKLISALSHIENLDQLKPILYCGSTRLITHDGKFIQNSNIFATTPSFKNAIVQSVAGGNTMVINRVAADLISQTPLLGELISHDWWIYILISGVGGKIYYESIPRVSYRQHEGALVGQNVTLTAKLYRIYQLLNGRYKKWNTENLKNLSYFRDKLTIENRETLYLFEASRSGFLIKRLYFFILSGARRSTLPGNIALTIGIILNKV